MDNKENQLIYASGLFSTAVYLLAVGPGDIRSRLEEAFNEIIPIQASLLPDGIRKDYQWICDQLTKKEPRFNGDDRLSATLYRMHKSTKVKIAKRIYELNRRINEELLIQGGWGAVSIAEGLRG
jgi:hypothetical protein